jgi:hypothetical protein
MTEPIACSLNTNDLADRRDRWHDLWSRDGIVIAPTDRGLRLTFRNVPEVAAELAMLVELERDCCAFADWSLRADGDPVVLDVSGESTEAIASVQGMFRSLPGSTGSRVSG